MTSNSFSTFFSIRSPFVLSAIAVQSRDEENLLCEWRKLCTYFDPSSPIPASFLEYWLKQVKQTEAITVDRILEILQTIDKQIHHQDERWESKMEQVALQVLVNVLNSFDLDEINKWDVLFPWEPHAKYFLAHCSFPLMPEVEKQIDDGLGKSAYKRTRYQEGLAYFRRTLTISEYLYGLDHFDVGQSYLFIGLCLGELARHLEALVAEDTALDIQQRLYERNHEAKYHLAIARIRNNRGETLRSLKRYDEAVENLTVARQIMEIVGKPLDVARCYHNIGKLLELSKRHSEALAAQEQSLEIMQKEYGQQLHLGLAQIPDHIGISLVSLSATQTDEIIVLAQREDALKLQQLGLERKRLLTSGNAHVAESYHHIGLTLNSLGRRKQAIESITDEVKLRAHIQNQQGSTENKITIFEQQAEAYQLLEHLKLLEGEEEALQVLDLRHARALVGILGRKLDLPQQEPITKVQMQAVAARYQATLLFYSCNPFRMDTGCCWVISPQGAIASRKFPLDLIWKELEFNCHKRPTYLRGDALNQEAMEDISLELADYLSLFNENIRGEDNPNQKIAVTQESIVKFWYEALIAPIADLLPSPEKGHRLMIIPDGVIQQLPFAIFRGPDRKPLIEHYTLIQVPSLEALLRIEALDQGQTRERQLKTACIVADPENRTPLPGAEAEGRYVATLFQEPILLLSRQATKAALLQTLPSAGFIHIACHGFMTDLEGNPIKKDAYSVFQGALALAGDQLFAEDIVDLPLNADCAVLSSCESGKGKLWGEGIVGLSYAFLGAGATTVIATRWKVPDHSTRLIIESFYRFYFEETEESQQAKREGKPFGKAEALREAMLAVKRTCPGNMQAWGGFFLLGLPD